MGIAQLVEGEGVEAISRLEYREGAEIPAHPEEQQHPGLWCPSAVRPRI